MNARHRLLGFGLAALVFAADRAVKWLVTGPLGLVADGQAHYLVPFFQFTRASNYGVSLGLLTAESEVQRWGLVAMTAAIALGVAVWILREKALGEIVALGLVLGGALGNIWDRVVHGHVIDYADLHFGEWRPFLIFNLADAAITLGVLLLLARSFLSREKAPTPQPGRATESQDHA